MYREREASNTRGNEMSNLFKALQKCKDTNLRAKINKLYLCRALCILNTENKSLLTLISFKIHCIPFSPTAETHDYHKIDEFTQRQQTAAKEQSHVASNIR